MSTSSAIALPQVRVNRHGSDRIASGHPWVFRDDLLRADAVKPGGVVEVLDGRNNRLGCAHYSSESKIALRMLPYKVAKTDRGFFARLIKRAQRYRETVVRDSDAYRVVHAEADLLPGLIVDRYGSALAVQTSSQGMEASKASIVEALTELFAPSAIVERNESGARRKEGLEQIKGLLHGEAPPEHEVAMSGLRFGVDLLGGQKTGLFLDQRENWSAAASYAKGKALDCFTHTGGFGLHLAGRCESVEAVDSSAAALDSLRANALRNGIENLRPMQSDILDYLRQRASSRAEYDTIVVDPPAFAKSRKDVESALSAYRQVNLKALQLLARDGVLVTCSCSHLVSEAQLLSVIAEASLEAGKRLRVIERRTQSRDHPILLTVPETHYLKCLILQAV